MMSMDDLQIVLPMTPADPNPATPVNEAVMIVDENGVQHFQGEPGFEIPPDIAGIETPSPQLFKYYVLQAIVSLFLFPLTMTLLYFLSVGLSWLVARSRRVPEASVIKEGDRA